MSRRIVFRHAAQSEFDISADWYEERRAGLGPLFTAAVRQVLNRIANQPNFYPCVFEDVREARVPSFPFCIYYLEETSHVVVISVFHTSRDPIIWQRRV